MEYIYAALILHSAGKEVTEDAVTKVMTAAGIAVDGSRVKALIAALKWHLNSMKIYSKNTFVFLNWQEHRPEKSFRRLQL